MLVELADLRVGDGCIYVLYLSRMQDVVSAFRSWGGWGQAGLRKRLCGDLEVSVRFF